MTIATQVSEHVYEGNGSARSFATNITALDAATIEVKLKTGTVTTDQTLGTHYSLNGVGGPVEVVFVTPPPANSTVVVRRIVPFIQTTSIRDQSGFFPEVIEEALDSIVLQVQQLNSRLNRAVVAPVGERLSLLPEDRAQTYLGFGLDGDVELYAAPGSAALSEYLRADGALIVRLTRTQGTASDPGACDISHAEEQVHVNIAYDQEQSLLESIRRGTFGYMYWGSNVLVMRVDVIDTSMPFLILSGEDVLGTSLPSPGDSVDFVFSLLPPESVLLQHLAPVTPGKMLQSDSAGMLIEVDPPDGAVTAAGRGLTLDGGTVRQDWLGTAQGDEIATIADGAYTVTGNEITITTGDASYAATAFVQGATGVFIVDAATSTTLTGELQGATALSGDIKLYTRNLVWIEPTIPDVAADQFIDGAALNFDGQEATDKAPSRRLLKDILVEIDTDFNRLGVWDGRSAAGNPATGQIKVSATQVLLSRTDAGGTGAGILLSKVRQGFVLFVDNRGFKVTGINITTSPTPGFYTFTGTWTDVQSPIIASVEYVVGYSVHDVVHERELAASVVSTTKLKAGAVTADKLATTVSNNIPSATGGAAGQVWGINSDGTRGWIVVSTSGNQGTVENPFAVSGVTAQVTTLADDDRLVGADISETNEPNVYITAENLAAYISGKIGVSAAALARIPSASPGNNKFWRTNNLGAPGWRDFALAAGAVGTNELANQAVSTAKMGNGAVSTVKLQDGAVTPEKLGILRFGAVVTSDQAITSTSSWTNVVTVSITPTSNTARIRIEVSIFWDGNLDWRLRRGSVNIVEEQTASSSDDDTAREPVFAMTVDAPASGSSVTYALSVKRASSTTTNLEKGSAIVVEEL